MSFVVRWSKTALQSLKRLDKKIAKRIIRKVEEIKTNPFRYVKKLKGLPFYTLRVGNYRVIMAIEFKKLIIFVIEVEHRRRVYEGF